MLLLSLLIYGWLLLGISGFGVPLILPYFSQCMIIFDEFQRSEGGLFIDLNTFLAFGKDYVGWNYDKTGNPVYLHIKQTMKLVPEDRPSKKPTLLAVGM